MASVQISPTGSLDLVLTARNVTKKFAGVTALCDVSFELARGEVHGLVGENGAGKSTLIKCLSHVYSPEAGIITIDGMSAAQASRARQGLAVIYQELTIVPMLSAMENVLLGRLKHHGPIVDRRSGLIEFGRLCKQMGREIDPFSMAGGLSVADQQLIEIMRAVSGSKKILLMDEPTASLGPAERNNLHETIQRLRDDGVSMIFVSHDLDEVLKICNRVSVMRNGELIETKPAKAWRKSTLVQSMLGESDAGIFDTSKRKSHAQEPLLTVEALSHASTRAPISFTLRRGEVLGIAGLVGSGRSTLLRSLAGDNHGARGSFVMDERRSRAPRRVRDALKLGIALAPEDRKSQGLVLTQTAAENVVLSDLASAARGGFVTRKRQQAAAALQGERVRLPARALTQISRQLSGGTQQKVVLAKWLHRKVKVLLLDEPTRGIDIGAKAEVYRLLHEISGQGVGLIIVSSELEEVVALADRVMVIARGEILATLDRAEVSVDRILSLIFGLEEAEAGS